MSARFPVVREAMRVGPHAGAHRVALRAGISALVPLLAVWATGHLEWSIYAAFGAFTSLYGRNRVGLNRFQMQVSLAVLLVTAVTLGAWVATSEDRAWLAVPIAAVVAGVGSWISDVEDWHPPGPLFLLFAFAAVASIPQQASDIPVALAVAAASATFAVAVGSAGAALRRLRAGTDAPTTPWRPRTWSAAHQRHIARCVIGVGASGSLATAIGIGHPYWAMVSAVVPLAARDLLPQAVRGVQRVVGTGIGLLLAALLLLPDLPGLALILLVVALQVAAELLVGRNYALALVVITPLALLMVHLAAPTPTRTLLFDRGVETVIGVVIGMVVGYATRERTPT